MNASRLLMIVAGVFLIARLVTKDSHDETLAGRLVGGQPNNDATAASTGAGGTSGGSQVVASQATGLAAQTHSTAFARGVLQSLRAPVTSANISSLVSWFEREGNEPAVDQYNPLDTTLPEPGSHPTNSQNVQDYTSWAQGVTATAQTIAGSGYSAILAALKSGKGIFPNAEISSELLKWSGGGYSSF